MSRPSRARQRRFPKAGCGAGQIKTGRQTCIHTASIAAIDLSGRASVDWHRGRPAHGLDQDRRQDEHRVGRMAENVRQAWQRAAPQLRKYGLSITFRKNIQGPAHHTHIGSGSDYSVAGRKPRPCQYFVRHEFDRQTSGRAQLQWRPHDAAMTARMTVWGTVRDKSFFLSPRERRRRGLGPVRSRLRAVSVFVRRPAGRNHPGIG